MPKKAFITGVTGQDGSYLAELLLDKGYEVLGIMPRGLSYSLENLEPILKDPSKPFRLVEAGLGDSGRLTNLLRDFRPDEVYNLAAQSDDDRSVTAPEYTAEINGMVSFYRDVRKIFAVSGILFNHESPRRGEAFVTRKITKGLAMIKAGRQDKIRLGNLESERDWGYAPDYVNACG